MLSRHTRQLDGPVLVVAPLSTLEFWRREVERFSELYACVYCGSAESRRIIRKHEWAWPEEPVPTLDEVERGEVAAHDAETGADEKRRPGRQKARSVRRPLKVNLVITSYTYINNDLNELERLRPSFLIVDESQRLKSMDSLVYRQLQRLTTTQHKLLLSGTPIQNNMTELFALLHFVQPDQYSSLDDFLASTSKLSTADDWADFTATLRPFLLRRWKAEVEKSLPPKEEVLVSVELTLVQKKYYRAMYERNLRALVGATKQSMHNVHVQLRKVCLTGDHRVLTSCGWKSIKQVQRGDEVLTFNMVQTQAARVSRTGSPQPAVYTSNYRQEWKLVTDTTNHPVDVANKADQLYRMQGHMMDVIATCDHRMLLARMDWANDNGLQATTPFTYASVGELLPREHSVKYDVDPLSTYTRFAHSAQRSVVRGGHNHQPAVKIVIPGLEQVCEWWWQLDGQISVLQYLGMWLGDGFLDTIHGLVVIGQKKKESSRWLVSLLDRVFPDCWRRNWRRSGMHEYIIKRCPPLYDYLRLKAVGPLGYNPLDDVHLRNYPHFTANDELVAEERKSPYYTARWAGGAGVDVDVEGQQLSDELDRSASRGAQGGREGEQADAEWTEEAMLRAFIAASDAHGPECCWWCHESEWEDGNEMLLCDRPGCSRGGHPRCASLDTEPEPKDDWLCPVCLHFADIARTMVSSEADEAMKSEDNEAEAEADETMLEEVEEEVEVELEDEDRLQVVDAFDEEGAAVEIPFAEAALGEEDEKVGERLRAEGKFVWFYQPDNDKHRERCWWCRDPSSVEGNLLVMCSTEGCQWGGHQVVCANLPVVPKGEWFCPMCRYDAELAVPGVAEAAAEFGSPPVALRHRRDRDTSTAAERHSLSPQPYDYPGAPVRHRSYSEADADEKQTARLPLRRIPYAPASSSSTFTLSSSSTTAPNPAPTEMSVVTAGADTTMGVEGDGGLFEPTVPIVPNSIVAAPLFRILLPVRVPNPAPPAPAPAPAPAAPVPVVPPQPAPGRMLPVRLPALPPWPPGVNWPVGAVVRRWNIGCWIIINGHWYYLKRWLGNQQQMANVYSRLSRKQALAIIEGHCRADGQWSKIRYLDDEDKSQPHEPTGMWLCGSSSFPLLDQLQLIAQLAGASTEMERLSRKGKERIIEGRTVRFSVDHWRLHITFRHESARIPFHYALLARPENVSTSIADRGYHQYTDDGKVYCITVAGNDNFLTQRLSVKRLRSGNLGVRSTPVFVGNCCHPWLLDRVEAEEVKGCVDEDGVMERMISSSGKLVLLDKFLPRLHREGHRVLIFSQMTRMLTLIEDYLVYRHYSYCRLDGRVHGAQREEAVKLFEAPNSDVFCFLLSTRAGGLGLTLTSADTVIIYDSDWNLLNDAQAIDRAHRIGQTKSVRVYRLLTTRSYEYEMFHKACVKLTLDKLVMTGIGQRARGGAGQAEAVGAGEGEGKGRVRVKKRTSEGDGSGVKPTGGSHIPLDRAELEELLRRGAYDVFADKDGDERSIQFCDEDIDKILTRSHTISYTDSSATSASADSAFSQATFIPSGASEALALDDPNFWDKLGLVDRQGAVDDALLMYDRRQRRQATYNEYELERGLLEPDAAAERRTRKRKVATCAGCEQPTSVDDPIPILLCDKCSEEWHFNCIQPPLERVPGEEDEWLCVKCVTKRLEKQRRKAEKLAELANKRRKGTPGSIAENSGLHGTGASSALPAAHIVALPPPAFCVSAEERERYHQLMAHYRSYYTQAPLQQIYVTVCTYLQEELDKRKRLVQETIMLREAVAARTIRSAEGPTAGTMSATELKLAAAAAVAVHHHPASLPVKGRQQKAQMAIAEVTAEVTQWRQQLRRQREARLERLEQALHVLTASNDPGPEIQKSSRAIMRQVQRLREELERDRLSQLEDDEEQAAAEQRNGHSERAGEHCAIIKQEPKPVVTSTVPATSATTAAPLRHSPSSTSVPVPSKPVTVNASTSTSPGLSSSSLVAVDSVHLSASLQSSSEDVYRLSYLAHERLNGGGKRKCWGVGCARVEEDGTVGLFSVCGACLTACYCSRECQVGHWRAGHATECKRIAKAFKDKVAPLAVQTSDDVQVAAVQQ